MIRVLFLINSLDRGGAERQLTLLVKGLNRNRFEVTVATIYDGGALLSEIDALENIRVVSLRKQGRWDYLKPLGRLAKIMIRTRPDIIHGYLDVANEISTIFGMLFRARVVWGIRASIIDFSLYDRRSAWHFRIAAWMSRFADLIITNSSEGRSHHIDQGFRGQHMIVIPNGFDTSRFFPDALSGQALRKLWGVSDDERLIGLVARLDPIKDHQTFLRAAALLCEVHDDVRFVCVGGGPASYARDLRQRADELGLGRKLIWAGELGDIPAVQNALDIATLSSISEGFPNVIGEAMACGVPCVVTDVGDSAHLVGSAGLVVPQGDPASLATAWRSLLDMPTEERVALGRSARQRIVNEFSLEVLARRTEMALLGLMQQPG